jgi:hypothetical protein
MAENERKSSVSGAKSPEEIGKFWDSHSLDDSPEVREVHLDVHAHRRRRVTLDPDLYEQVEAEARIRGVSPETLVNGWLTEKLLVNAPGRNQA